MRTDRDDCHRVLCGRVVHRRGNLEHMRRHRHRRRCVRRCQRSVVRIPGALRREYVPAPWLDDVQLAVGLKTIAHGVDLHGVS